MASNDPWNATDTMENAVLDIMAGRLEERATDPRFEHMTAEYLGAMNLVGDLRVLDLGCGTGVAARWIASQKDFSGKVLGIDLSVRLVATGRRIAEREGLGDKIQFAVGNSAGLDLPDASFDAVVAHTLLSHVDDPEAILREASRLTKPNGLIGVFDGDYASQTFEEEDPEASKANSETRIRALFTQPRVMRRLPRYSKSAGLEIEKVFGNVIADIGRATYWGSAVEAYRKMGPASGLVDARTANRWADDQRRYSDEGVFFGASVFYSYVLRRPPR